MRFETRDLGSELEVTLHGRLALKDNEIFQELMDLLQEAGGRPVVLDLAAVDYMDSAGLGKLIILREQAQSRNTALSLRNPRGRVRDILELARLGEEIPILEA